MKNKNRIEAPATSPSKQNDAVSRRLVDARLNADVLPDFPGDLPDTLEQAYAIQSASIARWPDAVAGWKIGFIPAADHARFSAERVAGPIFKSSIHRIEAGACRTMPIYVGGFAAVEAEFVFELGTTVKPSECKLSDKELIDIVAAMYVGAEIASSPMAAINQLGPTCVVSDFGNNAGLLLGPTISDWSSRPLDSLLASVSLDGIVVGNATADAIPGGPLQALRFLVDLAARQGLQLPAGTLISTGAVTGIHDVLITSKARVDFSDIGSFDVEFEAMSSTQGRRQLHADVK